jgi:hypothetical protein
MPLRAKITTTTTTTTTIDTMASASSSSSPASALQGQLEKAVEEGKVPQAVVFAASRDGKWFYLLLLAGKTVYLSVGLWSA